MKEFKNLIVLGPLIYALHHFEEHVIFNFRDWRLAYFADNNPIPTEEVLIRLIALLLIFVFVHLIKNNRGSAHIVLFFLMTTQVVNAFFHIFFSFYFNDFSPGVITSVLVYLPANFLIVRVAFQEGYLKSSTEYGFIALLGTATFVLFEIYGPLVIVLSIISSLLYFVWFNKRLAAKGQHT